MVSDDADGAVELLLKHLVVRQGDFPGDAVIEQLAGAGAAAGR